MTYGYARISTKQQSIDRQTRNIKAVYPDAHVEEEAYTGTKIDRPVFDKLLNQIDKDLENGKPVTLVFDSVSRMSRSAEDGYKLFHGNDLLRHGYMLECFRFCCCGLIIIRHPKRNLKKKSEFSLSWF